MSTHKAAQFAIRFVILGTAAATLGGFSGYAMRSSRAVTAEPFTAAMAEPQIPNRAAKTDRLAAVTVAAPIPAERVTYSLASIAPSAPAAEIDRFPDAMKETSALRVEPSPAEAPRPAAAPTKHAALPAASLQQDRPKRLPPPPPAPSVLLDDTQIAGVKARLRLTSDQAEYWPAVESALRDVVRTQLRTDRLRHHHGGKASIDVNSPEVQRLVWAAMPLLMRLREDQKREVRSLARVIGLESVASQI